MVTKWSGSWEKTVIEYHLDNGEKYSSITLVFPFLTMLEYVFIHL